VGLDLSLNSLQQLQTTIGSSKGLRLVRGEIGSLPFRDGTFDRVLCANVMSQIPSPESRERCLRELERVTRPGGRVVITVQGFSWLRRRAGWRREGPARGPSGPVRYVRRFVPGELRDAVESAGLVVRKLRGAAFGVPYRFKLTWLSRRAERLFWRLPLADWAAMIVLVAQKPKASTTTMSATARAAMNSSIAA
jgi:SAM-dependent methyltransferase